MYIANYNNMKTLPCSSYRYNQLSYFSKIQIRTVQYSILSTNDTLEYLV